MGDKYVVLSNFTTCYPRENMKKFKFKFKFETKNGKFELPDSSYPRLFWVYH